MGDIVRHRRGRPGPYRLAGIVSMIAAALLGGSAVAVACAPARPAPSGPVAATTRQNPFGTTKTSSTVPPSRVVIPRIGVDSPLENLGLDAKGALTAPREFARAGWYSGGTLPGETGPAVIAGHVNSYRGPAVFARLHELAPGDEVQVLRGQRWVIFRVASVARYPKDAFPTAQVYGPTPDAQLRLITCGGPFDSSARSYVDNVVVYAVEA